MASKRFVAGVHVCCTLCLTYARLIRIRCFNPPNIGTRAAPALACLRRKHPGLRAAPAAQRPEGSSGGALSPSLRRSASPAWLPQRVLYIALVPQIEWRSYILRDTRSLLPRSVSLSSPHLALSHYASPTARSHPLYSTPHLSDANVMPSSSASTSSRVSLAIPTGLQRGL